MMSKGIEHSNQDDNAIRALIPCAYVRIIAQQLGGGLRVFPTLLNGTSLTAEFIQQEDSRISASDFIRIFENALNMADVPDFGLELGHRLKPTTHGAMGFLMHSCPNLYAALEAIQHYLPTRIGFAEVILEKRDQQMNCKIQFNIDCSTLVYQSMIESCMVVFKECAEFILGKPLTEAKLLFSYPKPAYHAAYTKIFQCDFAFSQSFDGIQIPLSVCKIPNASASQENYLIAKKQCENVLKELLTPQNTYQFRVKKILIEHLSDPKNESEIASSLFMSKRTLARHLEKEGLTFKEVKDQVLAQQSAYFLEHTQLTIETISMLLNYHDASNFRRAFKRWFGMPPSQYRQKYNNDLTKQISKLN